LEVGKYQSFCQDDPLLVFNPNHSARWTPHEMLHRAVGFFWSYGASGFSHYIGARLGELLPVVHWYGTDLMLRLDEEGFDREADARRPQAELERALWLHADSQALQQRARAHVRFVTSAIARFELELAAIDRELRTGELTKVDHPFLDSSSDALAYVVAHQARLNRPAAQWLFSRVLRGGVDYSSTVSAMRQRVEACFDALLFGALEVEQEPMERRRAGRLAWDLLARAVLVFRRSAFAALTEHTPQLAASISAALDGRPGPCPVRCVRDAIEASAGEAAEKAPRARSLIAQNIVRLGGAGSPLGAEGQDIDLLRKGLVSFAPATVAWLERTGGLARWLEALVRVEALGARGPLPLRALRASQAPATSPLPATARALLAFEAALAAASERDLACESLGVSVDRWPNPLERGLVRASRAFRVHRFWPDPVDLHGRVMSSSDAPVAEPRQGTWLIGATGSGIQCVSCTEEQAAVWEALAAAGPRPAHEVSWRCDSAWLGELGRVGAVALLTAED
jgi:hypothetical protein